MSATQSRGAGRTHEFVCYPLVAAVHRVCVCVRERESECACVFVQTYDMSRVDQGPEAGSAPQDRARESEKRGRGDGQQPQQHAQSQQTLSCASGAGASGPLDSTGIECALSI